ncbi:MAG: hypothetical protein IMW89_17510 [Ktedonobacteraceae bacterium]|nr:hypothetical protein [Ktedonobacteraceae bacterium]
MKVPHITAALVVLVLIGVVSAFAIGLLSTLGPLMAHGPGAMHVAGKIVEVDDKDHSFIVQTTTGQKLHFHCDSRCLSQIHHMERHVTEKASTDIYYIQGNDQTLIAIDVD